MTCFPCPLPALIISLVVAGKDNGAGFEAWLLDVLPRLANHPERGCQLPPAALVEAAAEAGLIIKERVGKSHPWRGQRRGCFFAVCDAPVAPRAWLSVTGQPHRWHSAIAWLL